MKKKPMHAPEVLNEAYQYDKPVPFSRGTRLDIGGVTILLISGTASVTNPAPARSVASPASDTAPLIPRDPPTTSARP